MYPIMLRLSAWHAVQAARIKSGATRLALLSAASHNRASEGLNAPLPWNTIMDHSQQRPRWAPRVPRYKIWQLYHADAQGRRDVELLDEVGWALLARANDCLIATDALRGRVRCPICGEGIRRRYGPRDRVPDEELTCPKGHWSLTWDQFHRTIRRKHLQSAGLETFFRDFCERYPKARTYGAKMILVDTLLHRYHWQVEGDPGGPGAVNLIGGTRSEVLAFLNQLTYGEQSTPHLTETKARWIETFNDAGRMAELTEQHPWDSDRSSEE
jgi:hypothetical protein